MDRHTQSVPNPDIRRMNLCMSGVSFEYRPGVGLYDIELDIHSGQVVGVVGKNAAGKTTLFNVITGELRPLCGRIVLNGKDIARNPLDGRLSLGYAPTVSGFYEYLTVKRNLEIFASLLERCSQSEIFSVMCMLRLEDNIDTPVNALSSGVRQRLALARAILGRPSLLLLDEPTNNLDYESHAIYLRTVRQYADAGAAVLFASHLMADIEHIADRVLVLRAGRQTALAPTTDLLSRKSRYTVVLGTGSDSSRVQATLGSKGSMVRQVGLLRYEADCEPKDIADIVTAFTNAGTSVAALYRDPPSVDGHSPPFTTEHAAAGHTSPKDGLAALSPNYIEERRRSLVRSVWYLLRLEFYKGLNLPIVWSPLLATVVTILLIASRYGYLPGQVAEVRPCQFLAAAGQYGLMGVGGILLAALSSYWLSQEFVHRVARDVLLMPYTVRAFLVAKLLVALSISGIVYAAIAASMVAMSRAGQPPMVVKALTPHNASAFTWELVHAIVLTGLAWVTIVVLGFLVTVLLRGSSRSPIVSLVVLLLLDIGKDFTDARGFFFSSAAQDAWGNLPDLADGIIGASHTTASAYSAVVCWGFMGLLATASLSGRLANPGGNASTFFRKIPRDLTGMDKGGAANT